MGITLGGAESWPSLMTTGGKQTFLPFFGVFLHKKGLGDEVVSDRPHAVLSQILNFVF